MRYTASFRNDASFPVNIYWVDYQGTEQLMKGALITGHFYSQTTYFSHPWTFQRTSDGLKLEASAAGVNGLIFEGKAFGASSDSTLLVAIKEEGIIF